MSISLILVPAALAAAAALGGTGVLGAVAQNRDATTEPGASPAAVPIAVQTRMKDANLLAAALADLGATDTSLVDGELTATIDGLELVMSRTEADAPEVDGVVHVRGAAHLRVGEFARVKVERTDAFDLHAVALDAPTSALTSAPRRLHRVISRR